MNTCAVKRPTPCFVTFSVNLHAARYGIKQSKTHIEKSLVTLKMKHFGANVV
jgi:hypothetical protein